MTDVSALGDIGELKLTHVLNAPRELVWALFTEPHHVKQWWGPEGFTMPVYEADMRPGGKKLMHMQAPDGTISPIEAVFEEVVPPERLVTFGVITFAGTPVFEARLSLTFEADGDRTIVHVRHELRKLVPSDRDPAADAREGWMQQLGRLDAYLATL